MSADSPEAIKKHIKTYLTVGGILFFFTIVTVGAAVFLSFPIGLAILVALVIAGIKGGFVASIFMHLNNEKKIVYQILALTFVFFAAMMALPVLTTRNQAGRDVAPPAKRVYFEGHEADHEVVGEEAHDEAAH